MKIIKRAIDNVVLFAGNDLVLQGRACSGKGWAYRSPVDVLLESVETLPANFVTGGWTYLDEVWTANDIGNAYIADQAALAEATVKKISLATDTKSDGDLAQLRVMSSAEINDWFDLNVTTLNQCIKMLKKVVKSLVKKDLL